MKDVYKTHQNVIAYFSIEDGKVIFDINDEKLSIPEMMMIVSNTLNEFVKAVAIQQNTTNNNQQQ